MLRLAQIPLIRFILPFIIGILIAIYFPTQVFYSLITSLVLVVLYGLLLSIKSISSNYKLKWMFGVLIHLTLFSLGYSITNVKTNKNQPFNIVQEDNQVMIGEIISPPKKTDRTVKTTINVVGFKSQKKWVPSDGKVILFLQKDSLAETLQIGNYISFTPKIENIPDPKNPNEFDYKRYLSFHLIHQQSFLKSNNWKLINTIYHNSLISYAEKIRSNLITILQQNGLRENNLGVAAALILGYKNDIDAQLKSDYSNAGVMHVLAVSGLHVGIIYMVFNFLFRFLERFKYGLFFKPLIILLIIWGYTLITGLSPSVLRAAIMFSLIVLAKLINRNNNIFNTLAASAFILLLYNPYYILDVGFQLSYIAVIGIVIIQPWISSFFKPKNTVVNYFWELTSVSLAAQIITFPIGLFYFHQFPNYFLLANLLVIPLALIILYLGLTLFITSAIPFIGKFIGTVLAYTISFLNDSISSLNELPFSVTENIRFTLLNTILVYAVISLLIVLISTRKLKYLIYCQLIIVAFLIDIGLTNYKQTKQKKILVYNIPNYSALNFIDGNDNILLSDIKLYSNKSKMMYHLKNNWIEKGVQNEKIVDLNKLKKAHLVSNIYRISNENLFTKLNYLQYYNTKVAIVDHLFKCKEVKQSLDIDVLIWSKNNNTSLKEILKIFNVKTLIIDSSNSNYTSNRLKKEAEENGIKSWSVLTEGAYSQNISLAKTVHFE